MAINVSVQYNGAGFLLDMILLTQYHYPRGKKYPPPHTHTFHLIAGFDSIGERSDVKTFHTKRQ